jgi:hypothetical protein
VVFSRSTDGGATWRQRQLSSATNNNQTGGRQGCAIRSDSAGVVYVVWEGADIHTRQSVFYLARSFDGGNNFEKPRAIADVVDVGVPDPVSGRIVFDGFAGTRTDSFPSLGVANGAPTGAGATNTLVLTWPDARGGLNHEEALVQISTDQGLTWSTPVNAAQDGDRPDNPAVAISPTGSDLYLVLLFNSALLRPAVPALGHAGPQHRGVRPGRDCNPIPGPRWVRAVAVAHGQQRSPNGRQRFRGTPGRRPSSSCSWDDAGGRFRLWSRRSRRKFGIPGRASGHR